MLPHRELGVFCIYDEHILKRINYSVKLAAKELKLNVGWQVVIFSDLL